MANRSDFMKAKIPRYLKKTLAGIPDAHQRGVVRRLFIKAHAEHVLYKQKRSRVDDSPITEGEDTIAG